MNSPMVSVVMSVLNGGCFLSQAVESILYQSFEDFEFIIVDDGSTDASASTLDQFRSIDPRIHIVHQQNTGLVHALNRAVPSQAANTLHGWMLMTSRSPIVSHPRSNSSKAIPL